MQRNADGGCAYRASWIGRRDSQRRSASSEGECSELAASGHQPSCSATQRAIRLRSNPPLPGPQQLRQQERHEEKLRDIREQVAQGKLVIRKMTAEERRRYPPLDAAT